MKIVEEIRSVSDQEVIYSEYGEPDGQPPVLFIHGINMLRDRWGTLPVDIDRYSITVDLPRGADAPHFSPTALSRFSNDVIEVAQIVADRRGYNGPIDILSLSLGGLIAQRAAVNHRKEIRRMALVATLPVAPQSIFMPFIPNIPALHAVNSTERTPVTAATILGGDFITNPELMVKFGNLFTRDVDETEHSRQRMAAAFGIVPLAFKQLRQRWSPIKTPDALVMVSDNDPLIPYANAIIGAMALRMRLHTVPGGGHGFLFTRQDESLSVIKNFLDHGHTYPLELPDAA